jgi:hypothetical protein
MMNYIDATP